MKVNKDKILIVEDEAQINEYLTTFAELNGYQAVSVLSMNDAKQEFGKHKFLKIIVDLHLKDGFGFEFISWVNQQTQEADKPEVIILSGNIHSIDMNLAREMGVSDILEKPFGSDLLVEILTKAS